MNSLECLPSLYAGKQNCDCGKSIVTNYKKEAIKDDVGVGDNGIRREVLSTEDILFMSIFDIIFFI